MQNAAVGIARCTVAVFVAIFTRPQTGRERDSGERRTRDSLWSARCWDFQHQTVVAVHDGFHMLTNISEAESVSVLCVQEVHAGDFPTLLANQPDVYDGPSGSRGRDAGFLIHQGVSCAPTRGGFRQVAQARSAFALSAHLTLVFPRATASHIGESSLHRPDRCTPRPLP